VDEGELIIAFLNGVDTKHAEAASAAMNRIQCDGVEALPTLTAAKEFVSRYKSILGKMSTLNVSTHEDQLTRRRGNGAERTVKPYSKSSTAQPQPNSKSSTVQSQAEPRSKFEKSKPRCQTCLALGHEFKHDFKKCTLALEMQKKADKLEATTQTKPSKVLQVAQEDSTSAALCVRLDTQADIHIFNSAELLKNVESTEPISFKGYGDVTHVVNEIGTYNGIKDVYLDRSKNASVNLLSYAKIVDDFGCAAQYYQKAETFVVQTSDATLYFARVNNHYESRGQSTQEVLNLESETSTVQSREAGYKKTELQRFKAAGQLIARLGYPTPGSLLRTLYSGALKDTEVTAADLIGYLRVYGAPISVIQGTTTLEKLPKFTLEATLATLRPHQNNCSKWTS
jgi:hypothetical protein